MRSILFRYGKTILFNIPITGFSTNIYSSPEVPAGISKNVEMVRKVKLATITNFIEKYRYMKEHNLVSYAFLKAEIKKQSFEYFNRDIGSAVSSFFENINSEEKISIVTASLNEAGKHKGLVRSDIHNCRA